MNKKVIFGLLGLAAAGGIAYYFWQKKSSSVQITTGSGTPNNSNVQASAGTALPASASTPPPVKCKYTEGQLLKAGGAKVYYYDGACTKHWIPGNIFSKYGFSTANIKAISQSEMDSIPEGDTLQGLAGLSGGYLMWE